MEQIKSKSMNAFSQRLKKTFQEISKSIFEFIEVVNPEIRQVNEDGISSIILKKISKLKEHGIFVKTKSLEVKEGSTGVDFDLWIGENDKEYIRLLIQAKSFGNQTKAENSYKIDGVQCDKIILYSKKEHESFPLYFLYQHIKDENLSNDYFSFLEDFVRDYSAVTMTSAYNIRRLINDKNLKFSDIHENKFEKSWRNNIYELFQNEENKIGLPFYLLHDISPSKIKSFQELISCKNNSLGFFFFFFFGEKFPFQLHEITAEEIENLYSKNVDESEIQFKNLIIINDNHKLMRDNAERLEAMLK